MIYNVPGVGKMEINTIVLDLNGTLAVKGEIVPGVKERLEKLNELGFKIYLFTRDQRGTAEAVCKELKIELKIAKNSEEKEKLFLELNAETTAAIGNARIDIGKFTHAKLSIITLQGEGIHIETLKYADVLVPSIIDALDFFIDPNIFAATMHK